MGKDTKVTIQSKGNQKVSEIQKKKKKEPQQHLKTSFDQYLTSLRHATKGNVQTFTNVTIQSNRILEVCQILT